MRPLNLSGLRLVEIVLSVLCALLLNRIAPAAAQEDTSPTKIAYQNLFRKLTDLSLLAVPPQEGERSGSRTSTDPAAKYDTATDHYIRWDANGDSLGYLAKEGDDWVVFDQDGPGVIWRIWAGSCGGGHIKIFIDNAPQPVVDAPFDEFMGRCAAFIPNCPNLAPVLSRGHVRFSPIPYNKHCKIVLCKNWGAYYQFTYATYPTSTVLPEYNALPEYNDKIDRAMYFGLMETDRAFQSRGEYPYPHEEQKQKHEYASLIASGETAEVFADSKSGAITMLRWDVSNLPLAERREIMRGLKLKIYWDGMENASVASPLGDFFGSAPGYNSYRAYPMGMTAGICYSYFYMPYKAAKITLTNESGHAVAPRITILSEPITDTTAQGTMRFCAKWHDQGDWQGLDRSRFAEGGDRWPDWPIIRITGTGRFCGFALHVNDSWKPDDFPQVKWWEGQQITDFPVVDNFHWWGEGDEKFFVDGEKFPSTLGTGTEDYIGYSLAAIPPFITFDSAYACQSLVPLRDNNGLTNIVRFQITDNIPFQKSFDGFLEKYLPDHWRHGDIEGICRFACTVYWYEKR
jgi:hypothetical protein